MKTFPTQDVLAQLSWRYATKKFDATRTIPPETWNALEESLRLSPSSFGLQLWKFYVITDKALRQQLRPVSWNQPQIVDASHLLVIAAKKEVVAQDVENLVDSIAKTRNVARETIEGYRQMMLGFVNNPPPGFDTMKWTSNQAFIALGTLLTTAAMLGVDACPMEGFDAQAYDKALNCSNDGFFPVVLATLGYRSDDDSYATAPKVRYPRDEVIVHR